MSFSLKQITYFVDSRTVVIVLIIVALEYMLINECLIMRHEMITRALTPAVHALFIDIVIIHIGSSFHLTNFQSYLGQTWLSCKHLNSVATKRHLDTHFNSVCPPRTKPATIRLSRLYNFVDLLITISSWRHIAMAKKFLKYTRLFNYLTSSNVFHSNKRHRKKIVGLSAKSCFLTLKLQLECGSQHAIPTKWESMLNLRSLFAGIACWLLHFNKVAREIEKNER